MRDPSRPVRRRIVAVALRGISHLAVVVLVVGSAMLGVMGAGGLLQLDETGLRVVAPARGAIAEEIANAADSGIALDLEPAPEADVVAGNRANPTPPPELVAAIPLPAPPPDRSGAIGTPSLPWAGPTGYVDGDGSLLWPVPGGYVSQYFWSGHQALDIANSYGRPVVAADAGTVTSAGWRTNGGGLVVTIEHADGRVTGYNHLGSILVSAGQTVARGQQIASVGCTGICTGPHVHFQVIVNGILVNPLRYL